MNFLIIDTTTEKLTVCLVKNEEYSFHYAQGGKHNKFLMLMIDEALEKLNLEIADIDCFGAVVGPGSFTGIRVGISTINGLNESLNRHIISISSLEALGYGKQEFNYYQLIKANNEEYYCAFFNEGYIVENSSRVILKSEIDALPYPYYIDGEIEEKLFLELCYNKIQTENFTSNLVPMYLKESQAERLAKENAVTKQI